MIANLYSNILKHAHSNASISLFKQNKQIILEFTNDVDKVVIDSEKIYDRFYTTSVDGTGLGLYIIKKITERLNIGTHTEINNNNFTIQFIFEEFYIQTNTYLNNR